jgi:hypothetical protein
LIKKRRLKRVKYSLGWDKRSEGHVGKESRARRKCRDDVGGQGTNCTRGRERGGGQGAVDGKCKSSPASQVNWNEFDWKVRQIEDFPTLSVGSEEH